MKIVPCIALPACLALGAAASPAQTANPHLSETLKRMDAASSTFKSAQADFHKVLVNALIKDETLQDGMIYVEGKGHATQMGLKITGEGTRTLDYKNGTLRVFNPAIHCFNTVPAGNPGQVESFLALGFGGSGADLQKAWQISDLGPETLTSEGKPVKVEKLDLLPNDQSVKNTVTRVTLWIDLTRGIALKQELFSPSGDTQTALYTHIRLNDAIDKSPFEFKPGPAKACGK